MAEPYRPADEAPDGSRRADLDDQDRSTAAVPASSRADRDAGVDDTDARDPYPSDTDQRDADARGTDVRRDDVRRDDALDADEHRATRALPVQTAHDQAAPPAPTERQPVLEPAAESAPPPPKKAGNRLVATAWVLLAAGLFQVLFFGVNALVAFLFGGAQAVVPQVQSVAGTVLAWLPVLLFFLFFELVVLLINRAGRIAYVFASLVVAVIVYVLTVLLFSLIARNGLGDANTLAQTFLNWEFILTGLVAREVMLWTGFAIGSRGTRVRRRNKEARRQYKQELADTEA